MGSSQDSRRFCESGRRLVTPHRVIGILAHVSNLSKTNC